MKLIIELEVPQDIEHYRTHRDEWHPTGDDDVIAVDDAVLALLPRDPTDDSFVLLRLVGVRS